MATKAALQKKVQKVLALIDGTNGQFFQATFIKKDGTVRTGQFRTGVAKHTSGGERNYKPEEYNLRGVWEAGNKDGCKGPDAYRVINLETVQALKIAGKEHRFS